MPTWTIRELLAYLDRVEPALDKLSHFELLDVDADANFAAIQESFHRLAARLHPDRYRTRLSTTDHERLTTVYARLAAAYQVLRDDKRRSHYLRETARERPAATEGKLDTESALSLLSPKAQRLYRRAQAALRTNDVASAILNLRMALARDKNSALLREALAEAQARAKK